MTLLLVTAPENEPLTSDEARARLGIGSDVSDAVVNGFIKASRQMIDGADGWLGRALITQTWDLVLDHFPGAEWNSDLPGSRGFYPEDRLPRHHRRRNGIVIPLPPLQSIVSIAYTDPDNNPQTLDPSIYTVLKGEPSHIVLANGAVWPSTLTEPGVVTVQFTAGYGDDGSGVPETMRMAIALRVSYLQTLMQPNALLSENVQGIGSLGGVSQGASAVMSAAAQSLLMPYRVWT